MHKGINHLEEQAQVVYQGGALRSIKTPEERRRWPRRAGNIETDGGGHISTGSSGCVSFKQEALKEQERAEAERLRLEEEKAKLEEEKAKLEEESQETGDQEPIIKETIIKDEEELNKLKYKNLMRMNINDYVFGCAEDVIIDSTFESN